MRQKHLFIGAHPDDIEFGAGASIAKSASLGIECHALVFSDCHETLTDGNDSRGKIVSESMRALQCLGVESENMNWEAFPLRRFNEKRQEILDVLIAKYRGIEWGRIYVPNTFDVHQDHTVISQESIRAFKFTSMFGYELPWNNLDMDIKAFNPVTEEFLKKKIEALSMFNTQKDRFYSDENKIRSVLEFRGLQIGTKYAEGFQLIRHIEK